VGTPVKLVAKPSDGSVFAFWSGGCAGTTETCDLVMTDDISVTAHFVPYGTNKYDLNVKQVHKNQGNGIVTSNDRNVDCGDICSNTYYKDTVVNLSAKAYTGSTFMGWKSESISCNGANPCTVIMDKVKTIQAIFVGDYALKINNQGKKGGSGLVSSTPSAISCSTESPAGCSATYPYAGQVTLFASPDAGSVFLGWAPASLCPGTGDCVILMDRKRTVKAVFKKEDWR
jgi:hypothetical protein